MKRFAILDALRCVLAMCVALGHGGLPPIFGPVGQADSLLDALARIWRTFAFGPPAVIAFFVISGFCIHYPFAERAVLPSAGRFYARRYLRILAPAICTVALFKLVKPDAVLVGRDTLLFHSTLWSIACEEIYYAVYPLLNWAARRVGWDSLIVLSLTPMAVVAWCYFPAIDWNVLGLVPTTLMLFPVWLGGCRLAERILTDNDTCSAIAIWAWRGGAWLVMWLSLVLHFRTDLHQTITCVGVGAVYYFWIRAELRHSRDRKPWPILVWAGQWSYSLYLVHPVILILVAQVAPNALLSPTGWILAFSAILVGAYFFYLAVERPSHRLARRIPIFRSAGSAPLAAPGV